MSDSAVERRERRARWLLALGAAAGIALALASMLSAPDDGSLPDGSVARVNDRIIRVEEFERAVAALASDRRTPLGDADRRHVLDRLIDEELLVQYGLALGLARSDRMVRADLVSAVIAAQLASVEGYEPTPEERREFYRGNVDLFTAPGRLRVRSLWVRGEPERSAAEALERARAGAARLRAGESFGAVEAAYADPQLAPIPNALLPPTKLREYIGPSGLVVAAGLAPGETSDPFAAEGGFRVLQLVAREVSAVRGFEDAETEVLNEMKRRAGDAAVRTLLDELRANGRVETAQTLP